jgi:hypothetical protein
MRDKLEYQENENINNNNNIDNKEEGKENAGIPDFLKDDAFENHEGGFVEK